MKVELTRAEASALLAEANFDVPLDEYTEEDLHRAKMKLHTSLPPAERQEFLRELIQRAA